MLADLAEVHVWLGKPGEARQFARQAADLFVAIGEDWQVASLRGRLPVLDGPDAEVGTTSATSATS